LKHTHSHPVFRVQGILSRENTVDAVPR